MTLKRSDLDGFLKHLKEKNKSIKFQICREDLINETSVYFDKTSEFSLGNVIKALLRFKYIHNTNAPGIFSIGEDGIEKEADKYLENVKE